MFEFLVPINPVVIAVASVGRNAIIKNSLDSGHQRDAFNQYEGERFPQLLGHESDKNEHENRNTNHLYRGTTRYGLQCP